jgi:hypothetical protein
LKGQSTEAYKGTAEVKGGKWNIPSQEWDMYSWLMFVLLVHKLI